MAPLFFVETLKKDQYIFKPDKVELTTALQVPLY